jgi:oligopeptide transport system permease protein
MSRDSREHFVAAEDVTPIAAVDSVDLAARRSNIWIDAWRDLRRRPLFYISLLMVILVSVMALFPTLFTSVEPNSQCHLANSNGGSEAGHILGFTRQGCDVFSRLVWGARTSLSVGVIVTVIIGVLGVTMGAFAGFYGGWLDSLLSRIGDVFFSIPYFLAAVVVMSVFSAHRSVFLISFAIAGFAWASLARILRAEVLRVKNLDHVTASVAIGRSRFGTLVTHVLPNSLTPVIVSLTIGLGAAIVAEATLSFLGVGLGSSVMSWGNDISQAQTSIRTSPAALVYPSIALTLTVLAFITLGELVRDALDPKARAKR